LFNSFYTLKYLAWNSVSDLGTLNFT
jgi:hypothetical protein